MKKLEILKLVDDTFGEEVFASCTETVLGLECWIEGREKFIEELSKKLELLIVDDK
jgi:hypothetical protein